LLRSASSKHGLVEPAFNKKLFPKACGDGAALGCSNLDQMDQLGFGVTKDDARAVELFQPACVRGHCDSSSLDPV